MTGGTVMLRVGVLWESNCPDHNLKGKAIASQSRRILTEDYRDSVYKVYISVWRSSRV